MKMFRIVMVLGAACLFVFACSETPSTTIGQADQTDSEKKTSPTAQVEQTETHMSSQAAAVPSDSVEVDGMLMQTDKGLAVVTGTNSYVVAGKDLSDMIGKLVKVTGTIAEVNGGQVIEVMQVTPME